MSETYINWLVISDEIDTILMPIDESVAHQIKPNHQLTYFRAIPNIIGHDIEMINI